MENFQLRRESELKINYSFEAKDTFLQRRQITKRSGDRSVKKQQENFQEGAKETENGNRKEKKKTDISAAQELKLI